MSWSSSKQVAGANLNRHGLGSAMQAGRVCKHAEHLYPGLFTAVSLKNGSLHLRLAPGKRLELRLIEGKLLQDLQTFSQANHLPVATRIRLTIETESATL